MNRQQEKEEFAGYQIIEELPRGSQADVYKAIHKATKTKVALKVLRHGPLFSDKLRRQFEREIDLVAHLDHPYIVKVHDSGIFERGYYFTMEYIHGKPLDEYVKSMGLSFRETMQLFYRVCDGIAHAHQRGVIHRDLKPSNILVDERGDPHILDFGLAKAAGGTTSVDEPTNMYSMTGEIKGTLVYMSPEQAKGRSDLVDIRTDVYSLGVVFYLILIGEFPYDVSGSTTQILKNIESTEPTRPRDITAKFDSEVEAILLKALDKDTSQRYQSATELRHDIQCWLGGFPIVAKSVSSLYLLHKIVTRHRYTSMVVSLLLVILICFSIIFYILYTERVKSDMKLQRRSEKYESVMNDFGTIAQDVMEVVGTSKFFIRFIPIWRENPNEAAQIAEQFGRETREYDAAFFLLGVKTPDEFREKWEIVEAAFVAFVIGEYHLKNGNEKEAATAYRESLSHGPDSQKDSWLPDIVRSRLYELSQRN